ncbi:hypothetical protein T4E_4087 [Trichinella pseudospiralis]|uniref:Uncharacterized protein n=1 Tax=Trichinella pseudospiralis TaxID=6337 RepID=A0A0V0XF56_TRIPS|nr:hypothetical protein T4E_4087 [Trichinella pseudospiralis]KRY86741.1 hypothetical protein T4D_9339 [Trichinella pseudospiralis]
MYRLAEVEVAALYPRIWEVALNGGYQSCFKITNYCLRTEIDRKDCRFYNLESTIHVPGLHGCQQSNVGTRSEYQQFQVSHCPVVVHRELYPSEKRKMAGCRWLGGRGA